MQSGVTEEIIPEVGRGKYSFLAIWYRLGVRYQMENALCKKAKDDSV